MSTEEPEIYVSFKLTIDELQLLYELVNSSDHFQILVLKDNSMTKLYSNIHKLVTKNGYNLFTKVEKCEAMKVIHIDDLLTKHFRNKEY